MACIVEPLRAGRKSRGNTNVTPEIRGSLQSRVIERNDACFCICMGNALRSPAAHCFLFNEYIYVVIVNKALHVLWTTGKSGFASAHCKTDTHADKDGIVRMEMG